MVEHVIDLLKIPKSFRNATKGSTRIPKTILFKRADLTKTEKRILDEAVEELTVLGIAGKGTNIPIFISEERNYSEVLFILCKLKGKNSPLKVAEILVSIFDKPVVLILLATDGLYIAAGRKRINQNEKDKQITEEFRYSGPLNPDLPVHGAYIEALSIPNLKHINLFEFHDSVFTMLTPINKDLSDKLDRYIGSKKLDNLDVFVASAIRYNALIVEEEILKRTHKEERGSGQFGHGMQIHLEIKKKEKEKSDLLKKIKNTFTRR